MKKYLRYCLLAAIAISALVFCPAGTMAKAKLKQLTTGKTYKYDINNDGKKEKIRLKQTKTYMEDGQTQVNIYINGKRKIKAYGMKGCGVEVFTYGKKSILISDYIFGDGGNLYTAYYYKKGKYKAQDLGCHLFFAQTKVSGNKLQVLTEPKGTWWLESFKDNFYEMPFRVVTSYNLKSGKLKKTAAYPGITGQKKYTAVDGFSTGKTISSAAAGDGPYVSSGSTVTLKKFAYTSDGYFYQISINGKKGWFKDSSLCRLK